jgi:hypothetical protein
MIGEVMKIMTGWFGKFVVAVVVILASASTQWASGQTEDESDGQAALQLASKGSQDVDYLREVVPNLFAPTGRAKTFVDRETREKLKQIDILARPRRPLHFYGNAVRRRSESADQAPLRR